MKWGECDKTRAMVGSYSPGKKLPSEKKGNFSEISLLLLFFARKAGNHFLFLFRAPCSPSAWLVVFISPGPAEVTDRSQREDGLSEAQEGKTCDVLMRKCHFISWLSFKKFIFPLSVLRV